ncbi:MAG: hypothetical protein OES46_17225 [Gammaproteobacteria bacterium]|nr:hypothetical protein [Gammaproteobacteria bacterium]
MDIDIGSIMVIIGGWLVIGFLVALVLGKILREAHELGSQRHQPSEHDDMIVRYARPPKHPAKLRTRDATPTKLTKKHSKRAAV